MNNMLNFIIENNVVIKYCGSDSEVQVPDGVEAVSPLAFANNRFLKAVSFSSSVKKIGESAFQGCTSLETVMLNDGLEIIDSKAFFACGLRTISIPDSVSFIGSVAFTAPPNADMLICCGPKSIANQYAKVHGINALVIPETVKRTQESPDEKYLLDKHQASISSDQKIVYIPEGIESVLCSFSQNRIIERVILPGSIKRISDYAFEKCYNLSSIDFPNGLEFIGKMAFFQCLIEKAILPDSLEVLGEQAFSCCGLLNELRLSNKLKTIEKQAFSGAAIEDLALPEELRQIGQGAFSACSRLKKVELSKNLMFVDDDAFSGCGLRTLRILGEKTVFGQNVFCRCRGTAVYVKNDSVGIKPETFCNSNGIVIISEDQSIIEKLSGIKDVTIIRAPFEEEYNPVQHLKLGDYVPVELMPVSNPAYRLLQKNNYRSINQLLETPEDLLPEEVVLGKSIKREIVSARREILHSIE